jgi:hypothetical protein
MHVHRGSNPVVHLPNLLDGSLRIKAPEFGYRDPLQTKIQELEIAKGEIKMRIMTLVLAATLTVFIAGGQALAAKRTSGSLGITNPDRQYYKGAETCGGGAACYRAPKKKAK